MLLVDIHAHLDFPKFEKDLDKVIERARKAGVKAVINNGINNKSNRVSLELSKKYDIVKTALGLYPIKALELNDDEIKDELLFIEKNKNKIIAIGEVGLDYHWSKKPEEHKLQKLILQKIISLSEKIKRPLIIHSRKAESDVLDVLQSSKNKKIILHCFSGNKKLIQKAIELGYNFSIPTNIVHSKQLQDLVKKANINQLLTETDAPYLSPFKGRRNEPAFVIEAVKKIAEIKGFEPEETANSIFMNFKNIF